jgi:hypothetical protein
MVHGSEGGELKALPDLHIVPIYATLSNEVVVVCVGSGTIADELKPLVMSHTAKIISYTAIGKARIVKPEP